MLPDILFPDGRVAIPAKELSASYARSSGPGGQNVNKVNTKAELRWQSEGTVLEESVKARFLKKYGHRLTEEGALVLQSQRHRSQRMNMQDCLDKLSQMVADAAIPPKRRRPTNPTKASVERRLESKRKTSARKQRRRDVDD